MTEKPPPGSPASAPEPTRAGEGSPVAGAEAAGTGEPAEGTGSSLIICTRNRPRLLADTLRSIFTGTRLPTEVVVIDQSESPHPGVPTPPADRTCDVRYRRSDTRGLSHARNEGVAAARYDLMVFTDDDVRVEVDWFHTLLDYLRAAGPDVVFTGRVMPVREGVSDGFVPSIKTDLAPATYRGRVGEDVLYPHNLALHRSVLERVGPFDPRLGAGGRFAASEDNDFCHRLLEAGYEIRYVPDAVVHHRAWRSRADYLPLRWSYGRGQGAYYAKHLDRRDAYMAHRLLYDARQRIARTFFRWRTPLGALGELTYLAGLVSGAVEWLLTQPRGDAARR